MLIKPIALEEITTPSVTLGVKIVRWLYNHFKYIRKTLNVYWVHYK